MSEQDEQRVREIIREELQAAADRVENLQCRRCAAHDYHEQCDTDSRYFHWRLLK